MSPLVRKLYHKMSIAILLQLIILLNVAVLQSTMIFNNIFFELLGFYISRKFLNKYNIVVSTLLWWYPVLIALLVRWAVSGFLRKPRTRIPTTVVVAPATVTLRHAPSHTRSSTEWRYLSQDLCNQLLNLVTQLATFATETRYLLAADGFSCRAESHHGGNCQEALGRFSNKH
ncbi:hypothetical protein Y032_0055g2598 [Ancylostoma ceylanicum]|uniref:Uncharacterized protein n=1 Tax=Ancylostoma ceylanicum TaxID=53326 RepID=A0A016U7G6_9BILA|nr:hypothetical protein Y032_0055g2598 [Ancylostoma ceylanicum]